MMKRKLFLGFISLVVALGIYLALPQNGRPARSAEKENQCFTCHTNPRKLIQITREIAATQKSPAVSKESEGEG
jgi:hypothetical protein